MRLRVGDCTPAGARDGLTDSRCRERSRRALDEAVRTGGVDPGGRPVPDRVVEAGPWLVSERGPATVTLEAVAEAAGRSVHGRYSIFGTRDELLAARDEWYSPLDDPVRLSRDSADFEQTVASLYRTMAVCLTRGQGVATAMPAHLFGKPDGPTARIFASALIRAVALPTRYSDTTSACLPDHPFNDAKAARQCELQRQLPARRRSLWWPRAQSWVLSRG